MVDQWLVSGVFDDDDDVEGGVVDDINEQDILKFDIFLRIQAYGKAKILNRQLI